MTNYLFLAVAFLCFAAVGCNTTGVPVEHAKACDAENDGKTVEVSGFLNDKGGLYCSNTGGAVRFDAASNCLPMSATTKVSAPMSRPEAAQTRSKNRRADIKRKI